jgi:hypothetical protein
VHVTVSVPASPFTVTEPMPALIVMPPVVVPGENAWSDTPCPAPMGVLTLVQVPKPLCQVNRSAGDSPALQKAAAIRVNEAPGLEVTAMLMVWPSVSPSVGSAVTVNSPAVPVAAPASEPRSGMTPTVANTAVTPTAASALARRVRVVDTDVSLFIECQCS